MKVFYEQKKCIIEGKEMTYNQLYTEIDINGYNLICDLKAERNTKELVVETVDKYGFATLIGQCIGDKYLLFVVCSSFYGDTTVPLDNKSMDNFKKAIIYHSLPQEYRF